MKEIKLSEVKNGEIFKVGDFEFIKFSDENGEVTAVTKDTLFCSEFGKNNNLAGSTIIDRLKKEVLPKIADAIGDKNIIEHEVDLTSLDGLKTYGRMKSKISIPTFDFYRANVEIFDEYKIDEWWWLATSDTTPEHLNDYWCRCVSPGGRIYFIYYYGYGGVRPFLKFVSDIFVSVEK